MKRIIKLKALLCLCFVWLSAINIARSQLTNESFESYCGSTIWLTPSSGGTSCETVANNCVSGWYRSHGTPQLWSGGAQDGNNYMAMWNAQTYGEGVFTYKNFANGKSYRICMWISNNNAPGEVMVRLAKNLTQRSDVSGDCGEVYPSLSNSQIVYQKSLIWSTWTRVTFDFTANDDYSQFWIYPNASSTSAAWIYII
jgi:hypothetical protein